MAATQSPARKTGWDLDEWLQVIIVAGLVVLPLAYAVLVQPFRVGVAAFLDALWLVLVLLALAAWDLGCWLAGKPPKGDQIEIIAVPVWLRPYLPMVGLILGVLAGHLWWH
jgi:hypothetical protein